MTNWNDGGGHYAPGSDTAAAPWNQHDAEPCPSCNSDGDDKPEHPGRVKCEAKGCGVPECGRDDCDVCPTPDCDNPECEDGWVPCPEGCDDGWERGVDPQDEADRRADDECDRRRDEAAEGWAP